MRNYVIMIINALILIVLGIIGYLQSGSGTALIAPGIGVILLLLSVPVKNNNASWTHIAVGFSLLAAIVFYITGFMRQNTMVFAMAIVTSIAVVFYVMDFVRRKKERELTK